MRVPADLRAWASDALIGIAARIEVRQRYKLVSRPEVLQAALLGSGVLLVLGVDLGRSLLAG